jgi:hypothetical protein
VIAVAEGAIITGVWTPPNRGRFDGVVGIVLFAVLLAGVLWLVLTRTGDGPGPSRIDALQQADPTRDWLCIVQSVDELGLPGTGGAWDIELGESAEDFRIVTPLYSYRATVGDGKLIYWWGRGSVARSMTC